MSSRRQSPNRRVFLQTAAAAGLAAASPVRAQESWPSRTVKVIVPYPAGGSTDVLTRILADRMQQMSGQSFVVENRPGAGGNIGTAAVATSTPDGYTIGSIPINIWVINQFLYAKMPLDPEKDIVPASMTWELPNVFVVAADRVPAKSVKEFIAWAKQKGNISFGSPGVGTSPHLTGVRFVSYSGLDAVHVPFKGAAQTIPAMLAGDVIFAIDNLASYVGMIDSGKMRALAVTSKERWPTMKDVPTMEEAGIKDFVVTSWGAIAFPVHTPQPIIDKMSAMMTKIAADESIQARFLKAGARCIASSPKDAVAYSVRERAMWKQVVALSGIKPQ